MGIFSLRNQVNYVVSSGINYSFLLNLSVNITNENDYCNLSVVCVHQLMNFESELNLGRLSNMLCCGSC